jgi:hypothetical protein
MRRVPENEEILATAISGIPTVALKIAKMPPESRSVAFTAAQRSYLETATDLGYGQAAAQKWVFAIMLHLRAEVGGAIVQEAVKNIERKVYPNSSGIKPR